MSFLSSFYFDDNCIFVTPGTPGSRYETLGIILSKNCRKVNSSPSLNKEPEEIKRRKKTIKTRSRKVNKEKYK